jgi:hypothetical protein
LHPGHPSDGSLPSYAPQHFAIPTAASTLTSSPSPSAPPAAQRERDASTAGPQGTSSPASGTRVWHACPIRPPLAHLRLVRDSPGPRVPKAPPAPLATAVRADPPIPSRALCVPLTVAQPSDALHRTRDHLCALGPCRLHRHLPLGPRRGRLPPIRPDALAPLGHRVRDHPADTRLPIKGCSLAPVCAGGTGVGRHPLAIVARDAPARDRRAPHVLGPIARSAVGLGWHSALGPHGHQALAIPPEPFVPSTLHLIRRPRLAHRVHQRPRPVAVHRS